MKKIFTIGFTKKTAQQFFELLEINDIKLVLDIRLNNTSQLAAFSKYPDIKYFLKEICDIQYMHDTKFSPSKNTLTKYKKKNISWEQYVEEFDKTMKDRNIIEHIKSNYSKLDQICLLCSEATFENCHRSLVARDFKSCFNFLEVVHI